VVAAAQHERILSSPENTAARLETLLKIFLAIFCRGGYTLNQ
jgi:hypothetical protein